MEEKITCEICGKQFSKMGIGTHKWRTHGDGKNFDPNERIKKGLISPWNKGLTKETSDKVREQAESLRVIHSSLEKELDDDGKLYRRYINKCINAKSEGLICELTFDEYCLLVKNAGLKSSNLGFTGDKYVLARYNDSGNYTYGNCRFITQKENMKERNDRIFNQRDVG